MAPKAGEHSKTT